MIQVTVATLKLSGGHPALDFANTIDARGERYGPDVLQHYGDLLDWGLRLHIIDAAEAAPLRTLPPTLGEAALIRAKALREALFRIIATHPNPDPADLAVLQHEANSAQAQRVLTRAPEGYRWTWQGAGPDMITHRIAWAAATLLTSPGFARVHVCPGDNCAWLFLDQSRAGRRLWCSEATCGTRNRVRRWRDRQA